MSAISIRALGPRIGAEVVDWQAEGELSQALLAQLAEALVKHEALVVHAPNLTPDQHLAIANYFGEPEVHSFFPNLGPGYEQITIIDSTLGDRADMWHHDETFLASPPIITMTQAKILPPIGGDTCFVSMTSAYDALSAPMKKYLEGLNAWHDINTPMTAALQLGHANHDRYVEVVSMKKRCLQPMVVQHPVTGRKALYVSPTYTSYIDGVKPEESQAILNYLFAHCQHIDFMFRHRWQLGDLLLWDNRSVMHNAILDYQPHQRRMQRTSVFDRGNWPVLPSEEAV